MSDLRVDYGSPEDLYERLDGLVDMDPIKLRDLAWEMARDVETLRARIAAAEARGYAKAVAWLRDEGRWLLFLKANDQALYDEDNLLAAAFLEAEATEGTTDHA